MARVEADLMDRHLKSWLLLCRYVSVSLYVRTFILLFIFVIYREFRNAYNILEYGIAHQNEKITNWERIQKRVVSYLAAFC